MSLEPKKLQKKTTVLFGSPNVCCLKCLFQGKHRQKKIICIGSFLLCLTIFVPAICIQSQPGETLTHLCIYKIRFSNLRPIRLDIIFKNQAPEAKKILYFVRSDFTSCLIVTETSVN